MFKHFIIINVLSLVAFLLHGGTQIALLFWIPDPDNRYLFYIFAALWGMGDAVIQTQINGKLLIQNIYFASCKNRFLNLLVIACSTLNNPFVRYYTSCITICIAMFVYGKINMANYFLSRDKYSM